MATARAHSSSRCQPACLMTGLLPGLPSRALAHWHTATLPHCHTATLPHSPLACCRSSNPGRRGKGGTTAPSCATTTVARTGEVSVDHLAPRPSQTGQLRRTAYVFPSGTASRHMCRPDLTAWRIHCTPKGYGVSRPGEQRNDPRGTKSLTPSEPQAPAPMHRANIHTPPSPQPSAHHASPSSAHALVAEGRYSPSMRAWPGESRSNHAGVSNGLSMLTEVYPTPRALASVHASPSAQRHTPATCGERHNPLQPAVTSPRTSSPGSWRSLPFDDRRISTSQTTVDAPLSLHIPPHARDLPKLATGTTSSSHTHSHATSDASTLLPSIALLNEHAASWHDNPNNAGSLSMPTALPCHCGTLRPLLREFVDVLLELDDSVHSLSRGPPRTRPNNIDAHPVQSVHWMLERLRQTKHHIDNVARDINAATLSRTPRPAQHDATPTGSKRSAGTWEWDEIAQKRPRSGTSESMHYSYRAPAYDRPRSIDGARKDPLSGYSPARADSIPGSARPGNASPNFAHRAARALPSPSSITYSSSTAPSLPSLAAQSMPSPATSYLPASSLHTAPAHPATSAHIAELQHQVTLKSLALQTLQSEYASLLQKLQREKVRSQAIEKKTSVADQEVNELTSKNEDLAEQVKLLTSQLEHSERKREAERSEAERDKNQWGRMLEMSGRLQAKADADKQRLLAEKETLLQHVSRLREPPDQDERSTTSDTLQSNEPGPSQSRAFVTARAQAHVQHNSDDLGELKRTAAAQARRIELLKTALEQIKAQSAELDEKAQFIRQRSSELYRISDLALHAEAPVATEPHSRAAPPAPSSDHPVANWKAPPPIAQPTTRSATLDVLIGGRMQPTDVSKVSRARTPGPDELGLSLPASTSTSEELLSALGPAPAIGLADNGSRGSYVSQPSLHYGARSNEARQPSGLWNATDLGTSKAASIQGQNSSSLQSGGSVSSSANRTPDRNTGGPAGEPNRYGSGPPQPSRDQIAARDGDYMSASNLSAAQTSETSAAFMPPGAVSRHETAEPQE
ncbi:hypothetical protein CERZMDRAFT_118101 [Cercospora zeae-maydis SCOH1-5]|uniref:Uncharacterized protein n=1 Tax=Cercospora zeae-maydis SCOH1-5 TaxID=717836 RepID=A0A6A6FC22_9PEZI|nr:hypothetical protein CERZMDRAFT_118101 [Cercospora zeae-maydis SCOH1-5]